MIDWSDISRLEVVVTSNSAFGEGVFPVKGVSHDRSDDTYDVSFLGTSRWFKSDGSYVAAKGIYTIRNKQEENVIDWTKPLELVDGRKVTVKYKNGHNWEVCVEGEVTSRSYNLDGSHYFCELPNIRNVQEPATQDQAKDIIRALLQYSTPMSGLLGVIAREAGERYLGE